MTNEKAMSTELIEELFHEVIQHDGKRRVAALSESLYCDEVKKTVRQLIQAHERQSPFLNQDIVADLQQISPGLLDTESLSGSDTVNNGCLGDDISLKPGQRVGNYVVEKVIGTGGMSVVYRARQLQSDERRVAIKLIRPSNSTRTALKRFVREQEAVALLRHPNIAALYEVICTSSKKPVAVMELVYGKSILQFCNHYKLNWKRRISVFLKVCSGLSHAHRRGVVHRDVKPDNILVAVKDRKPLPKIIDFGIATIRRPGSQSRLRLTQTGELIGTPRYMSPEQFGNDCNLTHKTDIYSAALVLFELLAGVPFLQGETTSKLIANSWQADPDRLSERIQKVAATKGEKFYRGQSSKALAKLASKDLDWILAKALARNPDERYADMDSFARDLRNAVTGNPVSASAPSLAVRSRAMLARHRRQLWIGASMSLILLLCVGLYQNRNATADLHEARLQQTKQVEKTAAANELIMTLLASQEHPLEPDQFDLDLLPAYRASWKQIQQNGGPRNKQDRVVCGILAVMEAMIGDFDKAESLMETADVEHGSDQLRAVRDKICEKYAQAAKVRLGELKADGRSFEKASQQMTLARCYFVWGMYDDGENLLVEAISTFESKRPHCYESLVARLTLIKILQRSGRLQEMSDQLAETIRRFDDQRELISNTRGKKAWSVIARLAGSEVVQSRR